MNATGMRVVIAAGGLGTRVAGWAQFLPKEFQPVDGQPALLHLLHEITTAGADEAVLVYHRYYEPFIGWVRHVLRPGAATAYRALGGLPPADAPSHEFLSLRFVRQHGAYTDITSVLNAATHLPAGPLYVVFADNLYPHDNALALLHGAPDDGAAVLARPFDPGQAQHRGVIVTAGTGRHDLMAAMVEKPDTTTVEHLITRYGHERLRLLEGRFRIPTDLLTTLRTTMRSPASGERRLSEELATYGRTRPVHVMTTYSPVIDLGLLQDPRQSVKTAKRPPWSNAVNRTRV